MKKLVKVEEVEGEGLLAFLGKEILIIASSYFYTGKLTGVNTDCILLEDASIVFETGSFSKKGYDNSEKLPGHKVYIQKALIEAFCESK